MVLRTVDGNLKERKNGVHMSFQILGTGSAHPVCSQTNDDLSVFLDTSDEWISTRTGIKSRYVCTTETISDLAVQAGRAALQNAGITPEELDLILCSTIRGDYITPALACIVQKSLGATCPAFDINAACSGFVYALDVADGYFVRKRVKKVLVVAAEEMSKLLDWKDRRTCVLFGDAAGAAVLGEGEGLRSIRITTTGNSDALRIPHVRGSSPFDKTQAESAESFLYMDGQEVYKFAVAAMCNDVRIVLEEAGFTEEDVDYVLPHQANLRIIETAKKKLNIPAEKFHVNISRYGNTSSAGVAILMDEMHRAGKFHPGDVLVLSTFGGGLTTGACTLVWTV